MAFGVAWPGWISIEIPDGWDWEEDYEVKVVTIYNPEGGVGAFQCSFGTFTKRPVHPLDVATQMIEAFVDEYASAPVTIETATDGETCQAYTAFDAGETHWQAWYICTEAKRVFVTYNCSLAEKQVEQSMVASMIASLRWLQDETASEGGQAGK